MQVGQGDFRYEVHDGWEQLPEGWQHGDVAGVATDAQDRVYVFNRSEHPVIVYDRDGRFIKSWGEGVFTRPHGATIVGDLIYLADDSDHTVRKCTLDGEILMTLGTQNQPSDTGYGGGGAGSLMSITHASGPFNRPTRLSVAPNGELYVSDGYGNSRIHHFSAEGELLRSWGSTGTGRGQFNLPHSVWAHTDRRVFVCDRENDRIQIFSPEGEYLDGWTNVTRPADLFIDAANGLLYMGELYWMNQHMSLSGRIWPEERRSQISVRDLDGNVISRFGNETDDIYEPGQLTSPHGIWVDHRGDIYVGEVSQSSYEGTIYRPGCHSLQKFVRVR